MKYLFTLFLCTGCVTNGFSAASLDSSVISNEESDLVPKKMAELANNDFNINILGEPYSISMTQLGINEDFIADPYPEEISWFLAEAFGANSGVENLTVLGASDGYTGNKYYLKANKPLSGNLDFYNNGFFIVEYNQPNLEIYYADNEGVPAVWFQIQSETLQTLQDVQTAIPELIGSLAPYLDGVSADIDALDNTLNEQYSNAHFPKGQQQYGVTLKEALVENGQYIAGTLYSNTSAIPAVVVLDPNSIGESLPYSPAKKVYYMSLDKPIAGYNNNISNQDTCYLIYDVTVKSAAERLSAYCQSANFPGFNPQTYPTQYSPVGSSFAKSKKTALSSMVGYLSNLQNINDYSAGLDAFANYTQSNPVQVSGIQEYSFALGSRSYDSIQSLDGTVSTIQSLNDNTTTKPLQIFMDANNNVTDYVFYSHLVNGQIPNVPGPFGTTADRPGKDYHVFAALQKSTGVLKAYRYQESQSQLDEIDLSQYLAVNSNNSSGGSASLRERIESSHAAQLLPAGAIAGIVVASALVAAGVGAIIYVIQTAAVPAAAVTESALLIAVDIAEDFVI